MKKVWRAISTGVGAVLIALIRVYQYTLGPLMPMTCRFEPSCSRYAVEAVRKHGPWRGFVLATWRILRCNPFNHGGYDPVP
ncbi:MAG: membrane protein insertion efficiency factor YidD [Candidatus Zixiibacteriota bacterium]|jgi:putative membrane protein insertion efficiency factor